MTLSPLFTAPLIVQIHAIGALGAFVLGLWQLLAAKGTKVHRLGGWAWVFCMAAVAGSSFWITELTPGALSPVHILSLVTLVALPLGVQAARQGNPNRHRHTMLALFFCALLVAGLFTLLPNRIMGRVVWGEPAVSQSQPEQAAH
jgi:uncharacterized membrane protein